MDAYFEQQKACPVCGHKFSITRVRSSACLVMQRETDFRVKYRDIDPLLYSIWVCPNCQYASTDRDFAQDFTPVEMERLKKGLPLLKTEEPDFSGQRTTHTALRTLELALRTAMVRQAPAIIQAGLYLRAAWMFRDLGKTEDEMKFIEQAKNLYQQSFEKEWGRFSAKMSDSRIMYLIGELNRRLGDSEAAVQWFSRAAMNKDIKREPEINRLVRDQWETAREEYKRQQAGQAARPAEQKQAAKEESAAAVEQKPVDVPKTKPRGSKVKMYISLYMDQVDWMKNLVNNAYDKQKVSIEKEALARAVIDAVMEKFPDTTEFKSADDFKKLVASKFKD